MAKYLLIGAGMQGTAIAVYLAASPSTRNLVCADINEARLTLIGEQVPGVQTLLLAGNSSWQRVIQKTEPSTIISAASYEINVAVTRAAIAAGIHCIDLGGNNHVVNHQHTLHERALAMGSIIIPDCGLAPGLVNILAADGIRELQGEGKRVRSVKLRVGGIPQNPAPPLQYSLVFSVSGLINEYIERSLALHHARIAKIPPLYMSRLESIAFNGFPDLEALDTSGGSSTLPLSFTSAVDSLDYKTIRYPGHFKKIRMLYDAGFFDSDEISGVTISNTTSHILRGVRVYHALPMLEELGFFSSDARDPSLRTARAFSEYVLQRALYDPQLRDVVLMRVIVDGEREGNKQRIVYEMTDRYDETQGLSAMQRTTGFSAAIIAQCIAEHDIREPGVHCLENVVPYSSIQSYLSESGITISKSVTQL